MNRSPRQQSSADGMSQLQLRKVRKGTRSCWECKRRKIRCTFSPGNTSTCVWCVSHGSICVSQRYQDDETSGASRTQSMEARMNRIEGLLEQVLEKLETGNQQNHTEDATERSGTVDDWTGVDVVNTSSNISAPSSSAAVVSIFQSKSFMSEIGGQNGCSTVTSTLAPDTNLPTVHNDTGMWPKLKRISRLLLEMMPSRTAIDVLDSQSSPWICQLLRPLPSLKLSTNFSLLKMMPLESSSINHPTIIARALMCIVMCLQQLPLHVDITQLELPSPRNEYMGSLTSLIISLVTSDDEIVATPEGLECLLLLFIYFVNSGRPRRAWLSNRRALAIAQLMDLHRTHDESISNGEVAELWPHIIHFDRHLSQNLGFPCGVADTHEPIVPGNLKPMQHLDAHEQDALYLSQLDSIAALLIEREQSSPRLSIAMTQSIDNALANLATVMPQSWWHPIDRLSETQAEAMDVIYARYNIQLWHHQLEMSNHLPFMLDATEERQSEYSRIACLKAARQLINVYIPLRTTFGMFSCCMTNFQAFTAAVILVFNLFLRTPITEMEALSGQREKDWSLITDVISVLDAAVERFGDGVALQARDVLKLLQAIEKDPRTLQGDKFHFSIPYFGIISIARKNHVGDQKDNQQVTGETESIDQAAPLETELYLDYSPTFMTTIDFMGSSTAADADELMQQWLIEDM